MAALYEPCSLDSEATRRRVNWRYPALRQATAGNNADSATSPG